LKHVQNVDPEIMEAIDLERGRQQDKVELIASENFVSEAIMLTFSLTLVLRRTWLFILQS